MRIDTEKLISFIISVLIITVIIKFLWNNSLVKHISVLKPVKNLQQALLLAVSISAFRCCGQTSNFIIE